MDGELVIISGCKGDRGDLAENVRLLRKSIRVQAEIELSWQIQELFRQTLIRNLLCFLFGTIGKGFKEL